MGHWFVFDSNFAAGRDLRLIDDQPCLLYEFTADFLYAPRGAVCRTCRLGERCCFV